MDRLYGGDFYWWIESRDERGQLLWTRMRSFWLGRLGDDLDSRYPRYDIRQIGPDDPRYLAVVASVSISVQRDSRLRPAGPLDRSGDIGRRGAVREGRRLAVTSGGHCSRIRVESEVR